MMGDITLSDGVISQAFLFFMLLEEQVILRIYDVLIIKCNNTFGARSRRRQVCGFFCFLNLFMQVFMNLYASIYEFT